jgi:luciferase family oxidoreductase group 1
LIPTVERLGYHRFWAAEHHASGQSASPTIIAAMAAHATTRIRVGTAGILLNYHSPLKVAEDFALLELLYPGRIDLGLARGGTSPDIAQALRAGSQPLDFNGYAQRVRELVSYVRTGHMPNTKGSPPYQLNLGSPEPPEIWICGTSDQSAALAGGLGISYSHHHYLAQQVRDSRPVAHDSHAIRRYFDSFTSYQGSEPRSSVTAYGFCSESEADARKSWSTVFTQTPVPQPTFLGTPEQCKVQLLELQYSYHTSELVIQSFAKSLVARLRAYELIADIFAVNETT